MSERSADSQFEDDIADPPLLTLRQLIGAVRRRWWAIPTMLALVVGVAFARTIRQPHIYNAVATVRVQQQRSAVTGVDRGGQQTDFRTDPMQTEQLVIRSRAVAERVAILLGLPLRAAVGEKYSEDAFRRELNPTLDAEPRVGEYRLYLGPQTYRLTSGATDFGTRSYGDSLRADGFVLHPLRRPNIPLREVVLSIVTPRSVAPAVATRTLPQTNIIEISYDGTDPVLVRDIANATAHAYAEFSSEAQRRAAIRKSATIGQAIDNARVNLLASQTAMEDFKRSKGISDATTEQASLSTSIAKLQDDINQSDIQQNVYSSLLGKLTVADTADEDLRRLVGTDAIRDNLYLTSLYTRWFELTAKRDTLIASGRQLPNPDVAAVNAQISRTKGDLQEASRTYLIGLQSRRATLEAKLAELRAELSKYPPLDAEQARLMANVRTMQNTFDNLQRDYQLAKIGEADDAGTVQIIDEATTPTFAISPNRKRALTYATVLGLLLGVGLAFVLERLDDSIKSPDELTDGMRTPVLGLIPGIKLVDGGGTAGGPAAGRLVTHADPRSPVAEAYRSLRTNLAFAKAQQELRAIVVASPGPADGKSTTAANLAITFAQQGQRTILIDADLRRAVLDKTFAVPREPGLSNLIVGSATIADSVHPTDVPNLFVLPSGQFPPNPSELLGSPAMRGVLDDLRAAYDVVIFDSPPLLAVTDAAVLATIVDGTILVVRTNTTQREAARRALGQLRSVHGRVLGAVLNDIDTRAGAGYGGYGYYYYAYYGSEAAGPAKTGLLARLRGAIR